MALHFGSEQFLHLPTVAMGRTYTVAHWIRISGTESFFRSVWSYDNVQQDGNAYDNTGFDANSRVLRFHTVAGPVAQDLFELSDDTWYFVAIVRGASSVTAYWMAEGDTELQSTTFGAFADFDLEEFYFADSGWTGEPLVGDLAFARIWDDELTESELEAEAASATPVKTSGLFFANAFSDGSNAGVDASGNGNHFVETGEPYTSTDGPDVGGGIGEITGTVAEAHSEQTEAASGAVVVAASSAETQSQQVDAGAGVVPIVGALSEGQAEQVDAGTLEPQEDQDAPVWEQVTGHAAAWRSDLGITLDDEDKVSAWASQGGTLAPVSLQHGTTTVRPAYVAADSDWGGLPSLVFDGVDDRIQSDIATASWKFLHDGSGATVLLICRPTKSVNNVRVLGTAVAPSQTGIQVAHSANGQLDRFDVHVADSSGTLVLSCQSTNNTAAENENHAVLWTHETSEDPDAELYYPPGTARASGSGTPSDGNPTNNLVLGNWANSAGGVPFGGSVVEVVIWPFRLNDTQRAIVAAYVANRYGIGATFRIATAEETESEHEDAGSGSVVVAGASAETEAEQADAGTGEAAASIDGAVAETHAEQTDAATAVALVAGAAGELEADQVDTATAVALIAGSAAEQEAEQVEAGTALVLTAAAAAEVQAEQTESIAGAVRVAGELAELHTEQSDAGSAFVRVAGAATETQAEQTDSIGTVSFLTCSAAEVESEHVDAGAASAIVGADVAETQAKHEDAGQGVARIVGAAAELQGEHVDAGTGEADDTIDGAVAETQAHHADAGAGTVLVLGSATEVESQHTDTGTATPVAPELLAAELQAEQVEAIAGTVLVRGAATELEPHHADAGSGTVRVAGAAAENHAEQTDVGAAAVLLVGEATETQPEQVDAGAGLPVAPEIGPVETQAPHVDAGAGVVLLRVVGVEVHAPQDDAAAGAVRLVGAISEEQGEHVDSGVITRLMQPEAPAVATITRRVRAAATLSRVDRAEGAISQAPRAVATITRRAA